MHISRFITHQLEAGLQHPYIHILFGARQTGKTTLLSDLLTPDLAYNFADPEDRSRMLAQPGLFRRECEALPVDQGRKTIFVDEAQLVPLVLDAIQVLYDRQPERFCFVLCGSSARKLRESGANLLPGRSLLHRLQPLMLAERPGPGGYAPHVADLPVNAFKPTLEPANDLVERMAFGDLPGIFRAPPELRESLLRSYATIYLEEEIRREGYVKDWGAFLNFLKLAAMESGQCLNYAKIARETGLSQPTVKSHYQLLEDMFVGFRVQAFTQSSRKNLLGHARFLFFDLGVRHAAAGLRPVADTVLATPGSCFEQWVGMELHRRISYANRGRLHYFRTRDGMEIDYILEQDDQWIPIEVKWTEHPDPKDARHLKTFLAEHPGNTSEGYVVCRCVRPAKLAPNITAIPWWML
ncbi:MAG: ATP-binding protein [Verrucomicrobia bacterium]|nr:ATP-binding protein [Verrucomicrobiota bacterium]MCH8529007.1 AAA family ATPase [Kiritimatiellia bacterium]